MSKTYKLLTILFLLSALAATAQKKISLESPNGSIVTTISLSESVTYSVMCDNKLLMRNNNLQLQLSDATLGEKPVLINQKKSSVRAVIKPVVALKFSSVTNNYNALLLNFKGGFAIEFRAFDDGIAYRFITNRKGEIQVLNEDLRLNFPEDYLLHLQQVWRNFDTPYEEPYTHLTSSKFTSDSKMSTLPILIDTKTPYKLLFSEADVLDYPVMLIKGTSGPGVTGAFPKNVKAQEFDGRDAIRIKEEYDYVAKTPGSRTFPWRFFIITKEDAGIIENTMMVRLGAPCKIQDPSWIKPGQTVWDWWNYATPYDVDFKAGRNGATYRYFIDFAAANGIPYTLIDEGWANSRKEPFKANPNVDLPDVLQYAKAKGVKVILWMHWTAVANNIDSIFSTYAKWGVSGIKMDFMERNDQWMVNFYEQVARKAAENRMIVLFHGSFKPSGLEYVYPNVLAYEAVRGLEWKGEATADNGLFIPFMRNAIGPMDYTPGAMVSMQPKYYANADYNPAAIGTRAMQLAEFVVFESGMQMLADNPTRYKKEPECFDFIKSVPVTWDETIALKAKAGEYVVVAKRKGERWFIGAMTNNELPLRELQFDASFLKPGRTYSMMSFEDGPNADHIAIDYKKQVRDITSGQKITIKLARNGGWAAVIQ